MDTNVLVAALRSRRGASFRLLGLVDSGRFELALSVPLVLEFEAVAKRHARVIGASAANIDAIIDYLCRVAVQHKIYYLWRPFLRDPKDDMILELAVGSNSKFIVTHNTKDFRGAQQFAVRVVTPQEFLRQIEELP
jgi:putative PIN family toxin of toxin-antitoxin system